MTPGYALSRSLLRALSGRLNRSIVERDRPGGPLRKFHPLWQRHAGTIALVAVAAVLPLWPASLLESNLAWLTLLPAVLLAAIHGGIAAGLLATGLSCLAVTWLWPLLLTEPLVLKTAGNWAGTLGFIVIGSVISGVAYVLRRPRFSIDEAHHMLVEAMDAGFCVIEIIHDFNAKPIDYRFLEINPAFEKQTGLHEAKGKTMREMVPDHDHHWFEIYGEVARTGQEMRFEHSAVAMGKYYDVFAFRIGGNISKKVGILFNEVSDRKKYEEKLVNSARYDQLTSLPNRTMFNEYFTKALSRAERANNQLGVLFLDLDDFKTINDTRGHLAGDALLKLVAQRLLSCVRAGDLVSRLGGDEFLIILEDCKAQYLSDIADEIIRILGIPFDLDGQVTRVSTSIGIALYPDSATDEEGLIKMADAAMYAAKKDGKDSYKFG
jgi:diguanylate cyclase (GGDEF)-like protein